MGKQEEKVHSVAHGKLMWEFLVQHLERLKEVETFKYRRGAVETLCALHMVESCAKHMSSVLFQSIVHPVTC